VRVAYFTESLPPLTDGVARTYTWLARALNEAGVDFRFYSPCLPAEEEPWRGRVERQPYFAFPLYRYYRVAMPNPLALFRHLDSFGPDIIQVAAPTPLSFLGQWYARRKGLPVVSAYHTHFVDYFPYYHLGGLSKAGWAFLRRFHNAGARTYAPSKLCMERLEGLGFTNLELWERGLDDESFSPGFRSAEERRRWAGEDELLCLYVGRMVADKDVRVLAAALELARAKGLRLRCVFAGDGPLLAEMKRRLPLDHFPGFVRGKDLSRLYASADLFVFPSPNETFGNVVLEAMASGLPVLAAASGGPMELVDHGRSGRLEKPGDAAAFAEALGLLGRDSGLRRSMGAHGQARSRRYRWWAVHSRLIDSYDRVLSASSKRSVLKAAEAP
jgi:phosphatidylinositol alpha 1,6-mannosyltransferase